jgi:hypothetical protein
LSYLTDVSQDIRCCAVLGIVGLFLLGGTLVGQSRDDLMRNYGQPVSETFAVRAGVTLIATYSKTGRITEFVISPAMPDLIKSRGKTLSQDAVNSVIDELVPRSARGKQKTGGFINAACLPENDCNGSVAEYERVTIYYNAAAEGRVHYAVIRFKD